MSSKSQFKILRVEETPGIDTQTAGKHSDCVEQTLTAPVVAMPPSKVAAPNDVEHWRLMAIQTADRLSIAEAQADALRTAADEARARFGKYKDRLDKAQATVNRQQVQLVRLTTEAEGLRRQLAEKDAFVAALQRSRSETAKKIHAFKEVFEKSWWDAFAESATDPIVSPLSAGEEKQ